jgi:hypothetical protein
MAGCRKRGACIPLSVMAQPFFPDWLMAENEMKMAGMAS